MHKRFDTLPDIRLVIETIRECRSVLNRACSDVKPFNETYNKLTAVTEKIDELAGHLTGDATLFHAKPHGTPHEMKPYSWQPKWTDRKT